ncbi:MAG: rhodanese-like domain-containing protein [Bacteroidota bacterium]
MQKKVVGRKVQLIDVRTPEEFKAGHINGALNFNVKDSVVFSHQVQILDDTKPVYLYCRSGNRSQRAAEYLKKYGFTRILEYSGGYLDWKEQE